MRSYEEIKNAAFALPPETRAMFAEDLLESLDALNAEDQQQIDALWRRKLSAATKK